MKERNGWVSNSSSSSFIIQTKYISEHQKDLILDPKNGFTVVCWNIWEELDEYEKEDEYDNDFNRYLEEALEGFYLGCVDDWSVREEDAYISFFTIMDNFDYQTYINMVGIPNKYVEGTDE